MSLCRVLLIPGSVSVFVSCLADTWKCQCLVSWRQGCSVTTRTCPSPKPASLRPAAAPPGWRSRTSYCESQPPSALMSSTLMSSTLISSTLMSCTVMSCTVMSCTVMSCTLMFCTVMSCTLMSSTVMSSTVMSCTVMSSYVWCRQRHHINVHTNPWLLC